ncbi:hypothetical protein HPP92_023290 [Vanilla planifolia]|uniref:Uncharacterized protein n=1 Tax=Vanilla planifolia TaxID=51239 RepID=A0A835PU29_VANPL|nr:hypothetical protein HPP92_023588 [Vanilla planifolia]KAG0460136.1 hypothetical protein HPP92_023264 [Vanilla planifolia]KAG0460162.1 hypothetical protein HPP92_023290 [Vanilla planifolia]
MARPNSESAAFHSSIALLQERFKQLQRAKEMREEREQIRATNDAAQRSPTACDDRQHQPPEWFVHPDLIHPSRPLTTGSSFSHRPHEYCTDLEAYNGDGEAEIDTSLHL